LQVSGETQSESVAQDCARAEVAHTQIKSAAAASEREIKIVISLSSLGNMVMLVLNPALVK
jgi:hypothetical protein